MSVFKLSNSIFDLKLTASELTVYAYLCSLPSEYTMLDGAAAIKVKQATIASKCGIKAVQTVAKVITSLEKKSLVEPVKRSVKRNGYKGTYMYKIKKLSTDNSFFFVDRSVFGQLVPRQMMIYLFICKSYNTQICDCWNSYKDISVQIGMKRETVIKTIAELETLKLIRKSCRKSRENRRVYVDNHYILILYVKGSFKRRKRKAVVPQIQPQFNKSHNSNLRKLEVVYKFSIPQELKKVKSFFINFLRGSPQI
ncbi:MAG: helix-turn-helix domain-containing protein [Ruminococcus sp.]|nr:helix-turn-helix domain-containing protein [Ruminococcus sp.]